MFACLPACHTLFLGGFDWFSDACAPWLRGVCRVTGGVVEFVCVFGLGFWRGFVGLGPVVLWCVLGHGVFGFGIWRIQVVFGGFLGQISNFGGVCAEWASVLGGSWDDCPEQVGSGSWWFSCSGRFCGGV